MQQPIHCFLLHFITIINYSLSLSSGFPLPSANISTKWTNSPMFFSNSPMYNDDIATRPILIRGIYNTTFDDDLLAFGCGFICSGTCTSFTFSIFIVSVLDYYGIYKYPQTVWSANRDRPVQENATLEFSENGNLLLRDFDGIQVWSTNTAGKSVVGMELNEVGSLVLFDDKNKTIWSSIDYPTDSLVLGQTLRQGQRLTANISVTNSSQGSVYLSIVNSGFRAFVGSQLYYNKSYDISGKPTIVSFYNASLDPFVGSLNISYALQRTNSIQYMQLDYGGHLRIYEWSSTNGLSLLGDVFTLGDDCAYPNVCREYGVCSNGQCNCPDTLINEQLDYFRQVDPFNPNLGCVPLNAVSCKSNKAQQFLSLHNVSYFNYIDDAAMYMNDTNAESCKQACLAKCSCKAALFRYIQNASSGDCFLPSELYSLKKDKPNITTNYYSSAFIKVQSLPIDSDAVRHGVNVGVIVGSTVAFFLVVVCIFALLRRRNRHKEVENDDEFDMLRGLPTRFTFEDLRVATNDFLQKLGEGGFGSVFEGMLIDGTKIAVKRLDGVDQGKKEFLAEVETIGSIHHIHLVRLIGFCAEKSHRLLIYEHMPNGSLDKWIFYKHGDIVLDWQTRRKIITNIAKGISYLHEECRQKIVHLDIKPQNILLDENFNAKVSDFGLAKLIDRDKIEVMTRMRGTPGYLAPEWLTSIITEKVDVFSFGVVVLEIVCGRRNLDNSKDEESFHLISLLQKKVAENKLVDIIDCRSTDMQQLHIEDVTMIMHLAMWCLQSDNNKRPLMSVVLKVLEGSMEVEANLDYNFSYLAPSVSGNANIVESLLTIPWTLSQPR